MERAASIGRGIRLQRGHTYVYWHPRGWTTGAWLAVAYITLFLGSVLAGFVYRAGHPDGIVLGYLVAFVIAVAILPFFHGKPHQPSE